MNLFDDIVDFLNSMEFDDAVNESTPLNSEEINKLCEEYPELPEDFIAYLTEIGSGSINNCRYMIYGDLLKPSDIFNLEDIEDFENKILLFGDNFAGTPAGFLKDENWEIAELDHEYLGLYRCKQSFAEFIRHRIGIYD